MYKVIIKTKFNTIEKVVEDINTPEMKELYNQPYIEGIYIDTIEHYRDRLIEERNNALRHVVGTSYYNKIAQEKNNEIKRLKEK